MLLSLQEISTYVPWLVSLTVVMLGCAVQTALGFGMAVIAAPLLMLVRPDWVPYVLTSTALFLSLMNVWHLRLHLNCKSMLPAIISRIPGTIVGVWLLLVTHVLWLQVFVAASVLVAVVVSLFAIHFQSTPWRLAWAGFFSGLMGTATAIGGPPLALVMQFGEPRTVRANLSFYFSYSCVLSMVSYVLGGLLSWRTVLVCATFVPAALVGFVIGLRLQGWVDKKRFRPILLGLCGVSSGVALLGVVVKL